MFHNLTNTNGQAFSAAPASATIAQVAATAAVGVVAAAFAVCSLRSLCPTGTSLPSQLKRSSSHSTVPHPAVRSSTADDTTHDTSILRRCTPTACLSESMSPSLVFSRKVGGTFLN